MELGIVMEFKGVSLLKRGFLVCVVHVSSEPLEHWNWLSPMPTWLRLRFLRFDGEAFFAGGARIPQEDLDTNLVSPTAEALVRFVELFGRAIRGAVSGRRNS